RSTTRLDRAIALAVGAWLLASASCEGQIADAPRIVVRGSSGTQDATSAGTGSTGATGSGAGGASSTTTGTTTTGGVVMPAIGPGNMRRLPRSQVQSSLQDLLLGPVQLGPIQPDSVADGFASVGATYVAINDTAVEQYHTTFKAVLVAAFG